MRQSVLLLGVCTPWVRGLAIVLALCHLACDSEPPAPGHGMLDEFPIPTKDSCPWGLTLGPDGALWFTEVFANQIGRISTAGEITEFPVPTADSQPWGIVTGPDGNLWFTEFAGGKIGRITPGGAVTEFDGGRARGITVGPDGSLWYAKDNSLGRITLTGETADYPTPSSRGPRMLEPYAITSGADGNLWFSDWWDAIGRMSPDGTLAELATPTALSMPGEIVASPDGNVWFAETYAGAIGHLAPSGKITEVLLTSITGALSGIAAGPDGDLWFAGDCLGRIAPSEEITQLSGACIGHPTHAITTGPDGNLWFTEPEDNKVGRYKLQTTAETAAPSRRP